MTIYGVALLAICSLIGALLGDLLGIALNVKSNVGGVGIAMIMLIAGRVWLAKRGLLKPQIKFGIEFWAALYIPIVVAMAAIQNVAAAVSGGPIVVLAAVIGVAACLVATAILIKVGCPREEEHAPAPVGGVASDAAE